MSGFFKAIADFGSHAIDVLKGTNEEPVKEVTFDTKVKLMVEGCNYSKSYWIMWFSNKPEIEKAALLVNKEYKLECGILSFNEKGRMVNYLELSGKGKHWVTQFLWSIKEMSIMSSSSCSSRVTILTRLR